MGTVEGNACLAIALSAVFSFGPPLVNSLQAASASKVSDLAELDRLRTENKRLKAELQSLQASKPQPAPVKAEQGPYPDAISPEDLAKKHGGQRAFVRRDRLDAFYYLYPNAPVNAKGASVTFNDDFLGDTSKIAIQGFGSYVIVSNPVGDPIIIGDPSLPEVKAPLQLSYYAIAPFVYGQGSRSNPQGKAERSAFQLGVDAQFEFFGGGLFDLQNLGISPYYQTDFRGQANIFGAVALWEPYRLDWHLGGNKDVGPEIVSLYWRAVAEADVFHVGEAGLTDYTSNTDVALLGGTISLNGVLFQNMPSVGPALCGRISFNAQYEQFWNAVDGSELHNFHTEVDYDLGGQPNYATVGCSDKPLPKGPHSKTSLALSYDNGTDRHTLEERREIEMMLTYQY